MSRENTYLVAQKTALSQPTTAMRYSFKLTGLLLFLFSTIASYGQDQDSTILVHYYKHPHGHFQQSTNPDSFPSLIQYRYTLTLMVDTMVVADKVTLKHSMLSQWIGSNHTEAHLHLANMRKRQKTASAFSFVGIAFLAGAAAPLFSPGTGNFVTSLSLGAVGFGFLVAGGAHYKTSEKIKYAFPAIDHFNRSFD